MLSRFRDFLTRHRRKFIVTGIVVGGTVFIFKYAQKKLIEMQEKQARDFLDKSRRMQHFESTERTCNQVILGMGAELIQAIIHECSTDDLLQQLRENPANKLQLWEEMKIESFTRLTTFIYASSMLVVALRVQLNVLGGYLYHDTTNGNDAKANNSKYPRINDDLKQQYLSLIRYFIQEGGLSELVRLVRSKVNVVMRQLPLTKKLSLADTEQLFWSLQMAINSDPSTDPCSKMCKYLLPSQLPDYASGGPLLQKMFSETLDLLESDDASSVCSNNICRGFSLAVDAIAENYKDNLTPNNTSQPVSTSQKSDFANINSVQIPLARVIPIVSGLTSKGVDSNTRPQNLATSLLTFYVISEKSKVLGANVYETFSSVAA
ncbi:peroxisomal biogenesis factor 3 [Stomoxys calcitrans]|uniref:Peroxisomal biogenesis factor 3 n=1 Tax=Stomoxys calcitrans TaxID=35570 RepID=A0A1I8NNP8_STOCA|nr:peroxisomal biogenesis factor 3 [Stomoxys calcitrans]XP_013116171.1 peroxisomal biogenesis factor 3 [Stomoxys calcitrans]XP_013116173.1 peroxisomal biogenesis factor 3 [Stomoxys calcitrans]XP_013116174.1 peroxisomal biogenesis factor 3 [Stomoxys calcitrans]XP_013116175.1 peroxisomal biogenesis factor 3 [Stomoxys calcitrans]